MGTTTFSGPVKAGTVREGASANVGTLVCSQSAAITEAASEASTGIIIPANSQIINIDIVVEAVFTASSTTTIAIGNASGTPTNIAAAHNVSATAVGPLKMLQASAGAWDNIGTSDIELFGITVANSASAGKARIVVTYAQNNNLTGF